MQRCHHQSSSHRPFNMSVTRDKPRVSCTLGNRQRSAMHVSDFLANNTSDNCFAGTGGSGKVAAPNPHWGDSPLVPSVDWMIERTNAVMTERRRQRRADELAAAQNRAGSPPASANGGGSGYGSGKRGGPLRGPSVAVDFKALQPPPPLNFRQPSAQAATAGGGEKNAATAAPAATPAATPATAATAAAASAPTGGVPASFAGHRPSQVPDDTGTTTAAAAVSAVAATTAGPATRATSPIVSHSGGLSINDSKPVVAPSGSRGGINVKDFLQSVQQQQSPPPPSSPPRVLASTAAPSAASTAAPAAAPAPPAPLAAAALRGVSGSLVAHLRSVAAALEASGDAAGLAALQADVLAVFVPTPRGIAGGDIAGKAIAGGGAAAHPPRASAAPEDVERLDPHEGDY